MFEGDPQKAAGHEGFDELERAVAGARKIEELFDALKSALSEDRFIPPEGIIRALTVAAYSPPEMRASAEKLERYLAKNGVTRNFGIRDKAMELLLESERADVA